MNSIYIAEVEMADVPEKKIRCVIDVCYCICC